MKAEDYKNKEKKLLNFFKLSYFIEMELGRIMQKDISVSFHINNFYFTCSGIQVEYRKPSKNDSIFFNKDFLLGNVNNNLKKDLEIFFKLSDIISKNIKKLIMKYHQPQKFDIHYTNKWIIDSDGIEIYCINKYGSLEKLRIKKEKVVSFFNKEYFNMLKKNIDGF